MDTTAVLDHHFAAYETGDADEVLKDYTDESVLMTPDATLKGRQAIHAYFSVVFSGLFKPGTYDFAVDKMQIDGDVAYAVWHASCAAADIRFATDTWVVRDGKIAWQTTAQKIDPK